MWDIPLHFNTRIQPMESSHNYLLGFSMLNATGIFTIIAVAAAVILNIHLRWL
jgi:hypothetical protein